MASPLNSGKAKALALVPCDGARVRDSVLLAGVPAVQAPVQIPVRELRPSDVIGGRTITRTARTDEHEGSRMSATLDNGMTLNFPDGGERVMITDYIPSAHARS